MIVKEEKCDDLDPLCIQTFFDRLRASGRRAIEPNANTKSILEKLGLLIDGQPTRAAILLLCSNPNRFHATAFVKAGRFKSATNIIDDREFGGTLFEQIDAAIMWLQERMMKRLVIGESTQMERREEWQYRLPALREAIANAVCHRDYMEHLRPAKQLGLVEASLPRFLNVSRNEVIEPSISPVPKNIGDFDNRNQF